MKKLMTLAVLLLSSFTVFGANNFNTLDTSTLSSVSPTFTGLLTGPHITLTSGTNTLTGFTSFGGGGTLGGGAWNIVGFLFNSSGPTTGGLTGFGTTPTVAAKNGSFVFSVNVGTGGTASTGTVTLGGTAADGFSCDVRDITNTATFVTTQTATTTTTVTVTNYSRTTGLATPWTASDILQFQCAGY